MFPPSPAVLGVTARSPPQGSWAGAVNAAAAAYISGAGLLALPRPGHTGSPLLKPLRRWRRAGKAALSINGGSVCRRGGDGAAGSVGARPAHGELGGGGGHGPVGPGRGKGEAGSSPGGCRDTRNLSVPGASPPRRLQSSFQGAWPQHPASSERRSGGEPHCNRPHPPSSALPVISPIPLTTISAALGPIFPIQNHFLLRAFLFGAMSGRRCRFSQQDSLPGGCVPPLPRTPPLPAPAEPIRVCFPIAGNNLTPHI